jgi:hypothetical protein
MITPTKKHRRRRGQDTGTATAKAAIKGRHDLECPFHRVGVSAAP